LEVVTIEDGVLVFDDGHGCHGFRKARLKENNNLLIRRSFMNNILFFLEHYENKAIFFTKNDIFLTKNNVFICKFY
jgi:hypothetical protein